METLEVIFEFLGKTAWWHYVLIFIAFGIVFSKKQEWEYEAKLFDEDAKDTMQGEIEIEKREKSPPVAEIKLENPDLFRNAEFEIFLKGNLISQFKVDERGYEVRKIHPILPLDKPNLDTFTRAKNERKWGKCQFTINPEIKPENNDKITVKINSKVVFNGILLLD